MGYEMYFLGELEKYLSKSDTGGLYGIGWRCAGRLSARITDYYNDRIEVTVCIEVTRDNVNYSRVSETINYLINRRINEFFRKNPDAEEEIDPEIDLIIRKRSS